MYDAAGSGLLLALVPAVRLPRRLASVAGTVGAASLYLYLVQFQVFDLVPDVGGRLPSAALRVAAAEAGEPLWRMPLVADYEEKLSSKVADADNAPGGAGAITAALFLQHFVGDVPWAHLDVASAGDSPRESFEWTEGPTGYGARALLEWLSTDEPLAGVGR